MIAAGVEHFIQCSKTSALVISRIIIALSLMCIPFNAESREYHFKKIDKNFDEIATLMDRMDFNNERNAIKSEWIEKIFKIARQSGSNQLKARAIYWSVRCTQMDAQPQKCIPILQKAKSLCNKSYDYDLALINYQLAGNYERMGKYGKAYSLLTNALPVFLHNKDLYFAGNSTLLLAQLFIDIDDPDIARNYLTQSKNFYSKAEFPLNRIYFFEAQISDRPDKMIYLYKQALTNGGGKDLYLAIQALLNISNLYIIKNEPDSAALYTNIANDILKQKMPGNHIFSALVQIGNVKVLFMNKQYDKALAILHELLRHKNMLQGERFVETIYEYLWKVYERKRNYALSYKYLKLYHDEFARNEAEIRKQEVPKARAREEITRHNDAIRILEKDAQLSRSYMYTAILAVAIFILVAAVLFIYMIQRSRIRQIENRELHHSLQQEALIHNMNKKNFEHDIKQKECEISSSTLLLANKNEVLQQINDITNKYYENGQIPQDYVKQINSVIGDSLRNDDNWQRFKLHFDNVHPDFFIKLKSAGIRLTENDIRLCAYLRIGLRAKQIAEILSVTPDSVNTNRYRLRKKFGLKRGESLDDFIRTI